MKGKLKILMSMPPAGGKGGPPSHLPLLFEGLSSREDVRPSAYTYGARPWIKSEKGAVVFRSLIFIYDWVHYCWRSVIFRPDVLHLNSVFDYYALLRDIPYLIAAKIFRQKTLVKTHGSNIKLINASGKSWRLIHRVYFSLLDRITFLSPMECEEFISRFPDMKMKAKTAWNVVEYDRSKIIGASDKLPQFVFAGRFVEKKGIPELLEAYKKYKSQGGSYKLIMSGDGDLLPAIENFIQKNGLQDSIVLTGWLNRTELLSLFHKSSGYLITSKYSEGMPMSFIESLYCGCIILTTPINFVKSFSFDNMGVYISQLDPNDLSLSMKQIEASTLSGIEAENRVRFLDQFSKQNTAAHFRKLYQELQEK